MYSLRSIIYTHVRAKEEGQPSTKFAQDEKSSKSSLLAPVIILEVDLDYLDAGVNGVTRFCSTAREQ